MRYTSWVRGFVRALVFCGALLGVALLPRAAHASAALDLVAMAQAHEAQSDDDVAIRRYTEALTLDPSCESAYVGLGALRERRGDVREAERVYTVALSHLPASIDAKIGRARVRWSLGYADLAAKDLEDAAREDPRALAKLGLWYMTAGQMPAALAVWRTILARAKGSNDEPLAREARIHIKALSTVVVTDPVSHPVDARGIRKAIAVFADR